MDVDDEEVAIDFPQFCLLLKERDLIGELSTAELRRKFKKLDADQSGTIDRHEWLRWLLRETLGKHHNHVAELFEAWDTDGDNLVSKREFRRAVRALGFKSSASGANSWDHASDESIDALFAELDVDASGQLARHELHAKLRQFGGAAIEQTHNLRKRAGGRRGAALGTSVTFDRSSGRPIPELIGEALAANCVRVMGLFREWDDDGNGEIDRREFFMGVTCMGMRPEPRTHVAAPSPAGAVHPSQRRSQRTAHHAD